MELKNLKGIRAVAILIKDDEVLLMYRKNKMEYLTFPGGEMEEGESIEQAVLRELKEETTITAKINKLLYHHVYDNESEQYFYLCDYIEGEPKLGKDSIEVKRMKELGDFYKPLWVKIGDLKELLVYPLEIRDLVIEDFPNKFNGPVKAANIKISDLRQSI